MLELTEKIIYFRHVNCRKSIKTAINIEHGTNQGSISNEQYTSQKGLSYRYYKTKFHLCLPFFISTKS